MKLRHLSVEGVGVIQNRVDLDLSGITIAAVCGANGEGKSTLIIRALDFALYGNVPGDSVQSIISRSSTTASVTVDFDLSGQTYRVQRRRHRQRRRDSGPDASLSVADPGSAAGWRVLAQGDQADQSIVDLLGMSAQTAAITWLSHQEEIGAFCKMRPADRRAALVEAFGLGRYAELAAAAKTRAAQLQTQAQGLQERVAATQADLTALRAPTPLSHLSTRDLADEAARVEADVQAAAAALAGSDDTAATTRLLEAQAALDSAVSEVDAAARRWDAQTERVRAQVASCERDLASARARHDQAAMAGWSRDSAAAQVRSAQAAVEQARQRVEQIREQVSGWEQKVSSITGGIARIEVDGKGLAAQLTPLRSSIETGRGVCIACEQTLTPEAATTLLSRQEARRADLLAEHARQRQELAAAQGEAHACTQSLGQAGTALSGAERESQAALSRQAQVEAGAAGVDEAAQAVAQAQQRLSDAEALVQELGERPCLSPEREQQLRGAVARAQAARGGSDPQARRDAQQLRNTARERERQIWGEQEHRAKVAREEAQLSAVLARRQEELEGVERDLLHVKALQAAFSPGGIPAMILSGIVEELSDDINDVLASMGDSMGVRVSLQRSRSDERVMLEVTDDDGPTDYRSLGGSQKFRVGLACRRGLQQCLTRRTGSPVSLLAVDEGWGALDRRYQEAVLAGLKDAAQEGLTVLTVTHVPWVVAQFPTVVEVSRQMGVSQVRVRRQ